MYLLLVDASHPLSVRVGVLFSVFTMYPASPLPVESSLAAISIFLFLFDHFASTLTLSIIGAVLSL